MSKYNLVIKSDIKLNSFDYLLSFYITLLAFGGIGNAFQPIRVFIILFIPIILFKNKKNLFSFCRDESIIFSIWFIYSVVSIPFAYNITESISESLYLLLYFLGFFVFIYFAKNGNNPQKSILIGWILLFSVTLPITLVELFFDIHLPISVQGEGNVMNYGNGLVIERNFASVTFGNLNQYNTILTYILPFVFSFFLYSIKKSDKRLITISLSLVLTLSYIIIINSSRAAIASLLITITIFMLYIVKNIKSLLFFTLFFSLFFFILINNFPETFIVIASRIQMQGFGDHSRSEIIKNGLNALANSFYLGVGSGNFKAVMANVYKLELTAPHNLFLEVLVQYGLIIFTFFVLEFFRFFKRLWGIKKTHYKFLVFTSLCLLPFSSIINSGYLLNASFWILFYSLYVVSDKRFSNENS